MKSYTVMANGIRQFVVEEGEGAPVILLHGFPETNYAWRYQIPVLSRHYRVIAPDLRGYGETDKPASGYDKRNMARDIRELMRVLGLQKVVLVGHDRGAQTVSVSLWLKRVKAHRLFSCMVFLKQTMLALPDTRTVPALPRDCTGFTRVWRNG